MKTTVKYPASEPKDFGHGARINVVVTDDAGTEIRIYENADHWIAGLKTGDILEVTPVEKNGKTYYNVPRNRPDGVAAPIAAAPAPRQAAPLNEEDLLQRAALLTRAYCEVYNELVDALPVDADEETRRNAAATVFIALTRN